MLITYLSRSFPADLILLPISAYDVILGMDWLSEHYAQLDCRAKTISVGKPGEVRVTWIGEKTTDEKFLLSATEARKCAKKGATCFLAYMINKPKDQPKIEEVRVVKEFKGVFS